jgi:hypothetical protein
MGSRRVCVGEGDLDLAGLIQGPAPTWYSLRVLQFASRDSADAFLRVRSTARPDRYDAGWHQDVVPANGADGSPLWVVNVKGVLANPNANPPVATVPRPAPPISCVHQRFWWKRDLRHEGADQPYVAFLLFERELDALTFLRDNPETADFGWAPVRSTRPCIMSHWWRPACILHDQPILLVGGWVRKARVREGARILGRT